MSQRLTTTTCSLLIETNHNSSSLDGHTQIMLDETIDSDIRPFAPTFIRTSNTAERGVPNQMVVRQVYIAVIAKVLTPERYTGELQVQGIVSQQTTASQLTALVVKLVVVDDDHEIAVACDRANAWYHFEIRRCLPRTNDGPQRIHIEPEPKAWFALNAAVHIHPCRGIKILVTDGHGDRKSVV